MLHFAAATLSPPSIDAGRRNLQGTPNWNNSQRGYDRNNTPRSDDRRDFKRRAVRDQQRFYNGAPSPEFCRGGYIPYLYRSRQYYVNDGFLAGESGVQHAIGILSHEILRNMVLLGINRPEEVRDQRVGRRTACSRRNGLAAAAAARL